MAQGEVLEFEEYVRTRQDALLRSARRLVPDPVDAQDLLQTALARTYGRWDGIADKSPRRRLPAPRHDQHAYGVVAGPQARRGPHRAAARRAAWRTAPSSAPTAPS